MKTHNIKLHEIMEIQSRLPHGKKKEAATFLGIFPSALSRYINPTSTGYYRMPDHIYVGLKKFVNL
jgi:hypothetical protein